MDYYYFFVNVTGVDNFQLHVWKNNKFEWEILILTLLTGI